MFVLIIRNNKVELGCYYPMPFFKSAKIELAGITLEMRKCNYEIRYEPIKTTGYSSSYFHATYKDIPNPELGKDLVLLDTKGVEGQENWAGNFVGTSFIFLSFWMPGNARRRSSVFSLTTAKPHRLMAPEQKNGVEVAITGVVRT